MRSIQLKVAGWQRSLNRQRVKKESLNQPRHLFLLGDDEAGWRVAEEVQQDCWWVEAATFCSTRKFLSAKQAGGSAYTEKFHIL